VDVVPAEERAEFERGGQREVGEVLVAEGDDLALGNEERELGFADIGERGELHAVDFGSDGGR